jgi:hypothetical protein
MGLDFIVHVGGPAFLGLLGGGLVGAAHYYATKPMSIKHEDDDTGIKNTMLLSYRPAAMGALHDLITYGAAQRKVVLYVRNRMEELEAMVVYCETAPVRRIPISIHSRAQEIEFDVKDRLDVEFRRRGHAMLADGPADPWLKEIHSCILEQMRNCIGNMETIMRQRTSADLIGRDFIRGVAQVEEELLGSGHTKE